MKNYLVSLFLLCISLTPIWAFNCKFATDKGPVIDLTPLNSSDYLVAETDKIAFYFHPCSDLQTKTFPINPNATNKCADGYSLCSYNKTAENATFTLVGKTADINVTQSPDGQVYLTYQKSINDHRPAILLVCVQDYTKTHLVATSDMELVLFSPYSCQHEPEQEYVGPSAGTTLLIIFFCGLCIYLGVGFVVNRMFLGVQGVEALPNVDFWRDLPSLVKEGAVFISNGCKVDASLNQDTYESI